MKDQPAFLKVGKKVPVFHPCYDRHCSIRLLYVWLHRSSHSKTEKSLVYLTVSVD